MDTFYIDKSSYETIVSSLDRIASEMILHTRIKINEAEYAMLNIEIYYHSNLHPDPYTFMHAKPIGSFEFHQYGVDISLGNEIENYGGILIRGLYSTNNSRSEHAIIKKSDVVRALFNNLIMGTNAIELIQANNPWQKVFKSRRLKLGSPGEDENKDKFFNAKYKFMPFAPEIIRKYQGKEAIIKNSNLSDEEMIELLGYNLKKEVSKYTIPGNL